MLLSFDPGAERQGWAALERNDLNEPQYVTSGLVSLPRGKKDYQPYKLEVIEYWSHKAEDLFAAFSPDEIVCEIVPAMGFERSVQNQLAQAAITSVQAIAYSQFIPVYQISATTVKKVIGGSGRATKVKVRNGVLEVFPELRPRVKEWVKQFDEPDAIAIGLAHMKQKVKHIK